MPVCNGIGQSSATRDKEEGLKKLLQQHMAVVKGIFRKYPDAPQTYYYIDANAGCGYNYEARCEGSPLVFLRALDEIEGLNVHAHFIDINKESIIQLCRFLSAYEEDYNFAVHPESNSTAVPRISESLPEGAYGLVYTDPNGQPDWGMLQKIGGISNLKRFDILIRLNSIAVKRNKPQSGKGLFDYLNGIQKKHWMVREPLPKERWQSTFLLGMNWKMNAWKSKRFYYCDSEEGKEILADLAFLKSEKAMMGQQMLFSMEA